LFSQLPLRRLTSSILTRTAGGFGGIFTPNGLNPGEGVDLSPVVAVVRVEGTTVSPVSGNVQVLSPFVGPMGGAARALSAEPIAGAAQLFEFAMVEHFLKW
jgi:hypothetical protein